MEYARQIIDAGLTRLTADIPAELAKDLDGQVAFVRAEQARMRNEGTNAIASYVDSIGGRTKAVLLVQNSTAGEGTDDDTDSGGSFGTYELLGLNEAD